MSADASLVSRRVLALVALGWTASAALEVGAMLAAPQAALRRASLPWVDRLSLSAFDLIALAVLLAPLLLAAGLSRWRLQRWRRAGQLAAGAAVWLAFTFILTSWVGLRAEGMFLDLEGLAAWAPHPTQVFKWVHPALVLLPPLLAAGLTLALVRWLPRLVERLPDRRLVSVSLGCLLGLSALQLGFAVTRRAPARGAELVVDEEASAVKYSRDANYAEAQRTSAGAWAHLLLDLWYVVAPALDEPQLAPGAQVVRAPLVTLEEHLRGVPADAPRYNVVVVEVESMRADRLRAFGAEREVMPVLDAFAAQAARFPRTWTVAPQTNYAAPAPLSSQYPLRSARMYVYPKVSPFPRVMLYDVLKARGYAVGVFSSQDERWGNMDSYLRTPAVDRFFEAGSFLDSPEGQAAQAGFGRAKLKDVEGGCLDDAITLDQALGWLGERPEGEPFFLSLNLQVSHFPYTLPPSATRRYGPATVDFSLTYASWPLERAAEVKGLYDDALGYVDGQLGRLLAALDARRLTGSTIVVITADHGEAFGEHGESCHANTLYDEALRIPLLVRAPGLAAGDRDAAAQLLDVPPTVAGLLQLPLHPAWQGVDLFGPLPDPRDIFAVVHTPLGHQSAVVSGREKLIDDHDSGRARLFDLGVDPKELRDLALERPARVKALRARLDSWRAVQLRYYRDPVQQAVSYPPKLLPMP